MSRFISFIVLLASIVIIGALFYKVMIGFFVPVFLAAVLVVVFRPLHRWVLEKVGKREYLAAGITTALVIFSVLLPAALIISMAAIQGTSLVASINPINISIGLNNARKRVGLQSPCQEIIRKIQADVFDIQKVVGSSTKVELSDRTGKLAGLTKQIGIELNQLVPTLKSFLEKDGNATGVADFETQQKKWNAAIGDFRTSLKQLSEASGIRGGPTIATDQAKESNTPPIEPDIDVIELQSMAIRLGADWQETRVTLLGGNAMMASLRELANPSPLQIKEFTSVAIGYLQPKLISITGATAEFLVRLLIGSAIMIVSMYFFLYDGPAMINSLMKLSPLDDRYEMELLIEFDRISRAIVLAMIFSAIVQGLTAGLGYYLVGIPALILLTLLSVLCGLIPFVGPSVIWVPVCIYLAVYEERYLAASLLAVWGLVAVASVDNVVKAYVLHGQSQLHPLLALLSVLGGVQALGPIGIVVGPISVVLLQTLLGILQRELSHMDQPALAEAGSDAPTKSMSRWMSKLKPRAFANSSTVAPRSNPESKVDSKDEDQLNGKDAALEDYHE
ncbi:MAG: AI-2E family transporter [Pirellulaceae bacterium]|nr:AI-2E family transporter [Pirellulaceae bacterium]